MSVVNDQIFLNVGPHDHQKNDTQINKKWDSKSQHNNMLNVANKPVMLGNVLLSVIRLIVGIMSVVAPFF
jgi:hypothetical protein